MTYKDFKLKINTETNIARLKNGVEFKVLQYLPVEDKIDLVQIALQKAEENGIYNEIKLEMYFYLYLIYMYTDIEFTDEDKEDEYKLYNELESNDIILATIGAMEETEYDKLEDYLNTMKIENIEYRESTAALLQSVIQDLPKNAAAAADIVNNFDRDKYQNIVDFVKSANADRFI